MAAFVVAYPDAGYLVPVSNGGVDFELPFPSTAIVLAFLFFIPFAAALLTIRKRKRAACVFLVLGAFAAAVFATSHWTAALVPRLAGWSSPFVAFAAFWLGTGNRGWPPLLAVAPRRLARRLATGFAACLALAGLVLLTTFALTAFWSTAHWSINCKGPGYFVRPLYSGNAVFTARLIRTGHAGKVQGKWAGDWAIGLVEERFWGSPAWARMALITNSRFWEGQTFFIAGRRERGLLTRFLPIVDTQFCVGIARPKDEEEIRLRHLRHPPSAAGVRIVGAVRSPKRFSPRPKQINGRPDVYDWAFNGQVADLPLAGARIGVTGSSGTWIVTTDRLGVYEVAGLPLDDYTLKLLDVPLNQHVQDLKLAKTDLAGGPLYPVGFQLEWDGSIDGRVRDAAGRPAQAYLELRNLDEKNPVWAITDTLLTGKDGTFRAAKLPTGSRYVLLLNSFGPHQDSPYATVYYPSALRPEDARILEIKPEDPHIRNLQFVVTRLPERTLHVRTAWPNGQPVGGAWVHVAYEHTREWEDPTSSVQGGITDQKGVSELHLFGDLRVRVFAVEYVEDKMVSSPRYSALVELETGKLPPSLDLVVSSSDLRRSR